MVEYDPTSEVGGTLQAYRVLMGSILSGLFGKPEQFAVHGFAIEIPFDCELVSWLVVLRLIEGQDSSNQDHQHVFDYIS